MVFSSIVFLFLFLPIVLTIYFVVLKRRKARNLLLLATSLFFYAWGDPVHVLLLIGSVFGNYLFGLWIDHHRSKGGKSAAIMTVMLLFNLGILAVFKYLGFAVSIWNDVFALQLQVPEIVLPIGISFFTFQGISYVIDIYRGEAEALRNPLDVALYIAFFPQLVAGPIIRFRTIAEQIYHRNENEHDIAAGIARFIEGVAMKVLLANQFSIVADKAFAYEGAGLSVVFAWIGAIAYALQIYFDFAGYSSMAIGLARIFGFHFPENFNSPYISRSVSEFWRRWHISLGTWFRDYVYIPLGGSRCAGWKVIRNLFVVWLLTGLWHGANWTFVIWGLYFFVLIGIEKLFKLETFFAAHRWVGHIYLILAILFGWVLFRATSITHAIQYVSSMFGLNDNVIVGDTAQLYLTEYLILFVVGIICCFPIRAYVTKKHLFEGSKKPLVYGLLLTFVFVLSIAHLVKGSYNPFIYFNF